MQIQRRGVSQDDHLKILKIFAMHSKVEMKLFDVYLQFDYHDYQNLDQILNLVVQNFPKNLLPNICSNDIELIYESRIIQTQDEYQKLFKYTQQNKFKCHIKDLKIFLQILNDKNNSDQNRKNIVLIHKKDLIKPRLLKIKQQSLSIYKFNKQKKLQFNVNDIEQIIKDTTQNELKLSKITFKFKNEFKVQDIVMLLNILEFPEILQIYYDISKAQDVIDQNIFMVHIHETNGVSVYNLELKQDSFSLKNNQQQKYNIEYESLTKLNKQGNIVEIEFNNEKLKLEFQNESQFKILKEKIKDTNFKQNSKKEELLKLWNDYLFEIVFKNYGFKNLGFITIDMEKKEIKIIDKEQKNIKIDENLDIQSYNIGRKKLTLILKDQKINFKFVHQLQKIQFESLYYTVQNQNSPLMMSRWKKAISVSCFTWNLGFYEQNTNIFKCDSDIIAIGFQEQIWIENLKQTLDQYDLIQEKTMWWTMILVFVKKQFKYQISNIHTDNIAIGVGNFMGNKGAVMISFRIYETQITFINCHLAAQQNNLQRRLEDYLNIQKAFSIGKQKLDVSFESDFCFWMGDFNFRVDYPFDEAIKLIEKQQHLKLFQYCQFIKYKQNNQMFNSFFEQKLDFKPTYRRNRDNQEYSNKKNQTPSWTDRIFYKSINNDDIQQMEYKSYEKQMGSDHKPVKAQFNIYFEFPYFKNDISQQPTYITFQQITLVLEINKLQEIYKNINIQQIFIQFISNFQQKKQTFKLESIQNKFQANEIQLDLAINDYEYLKNKKIKCLCFTKINLKNITICQSYLSLNQILDKKEIQQKITQECYLYDCCVGEINFQK